MPGHTVITNGQTVTTTHFNEYMIGQSTRKFASTSDRDSQMTTPVEGDYCDTADTNMLWRYDGAAWREVRPWMVIKGADEGVTNSATVQDDNHLLFPALANGVYFVEIGLDITVSGSSSLADFKMGWNVPSGASFTGGLIGPDVAMTAASSVGSGEWVGLVGASASTLSRGLFSTGTTFMWGKFTISMSSTPGTVTLQWAQAAATAGVTTTVKSGSWIQAQRYT